MNAQVQGAHIVSGTAPNIQQVQPSAGAQQLIVGSLDLLDGTVSAGGVEVVHEGRWICCLVDAKGLPRLLVVAGQNCDLVSWRWP